MVKYGYGYEYVVEDMLEKGIYKENIGKWVAIVENDYIIADSGKEAFLKMRKKYGDIEPFVCKIYAPNKYTIIIAAA